jgi:hypothetical protein
MPMTPGADHRDRTGQVVERKDPVAVEDLLVVERHVMRPERHRADGQQDGICGELESLALFAIDLDAVLALEPGIAPERGDLVAGELVFEHLDLVVERDVEPRPEIAGRQVLLDPVGAAVKPPLAPAGQVQRGLPQCLGRNGAGVNRNPAHPVAAFHDQNLLAEFRGLNGRPPPRRAAADNDEVVMFHEEKPRVRV